MGEIVEKYPKINTLYNRDDEGKVIQGVLSRPEFANINHWIVQEKVDGTNVRIFWDGYDRVMFFGRTWKAQLPEELQEHLSEKFDEVLFKNQFDLGTKVVLYGEGYGGNIQKVGGKYSDTPKFIMFDVKVGDWWLDRESVFTLGEEMGIDVVDSYGMLTIERIEQFVKSKPKSFLAKNNTGEDLVVEGIVAKPYPLLLFRDGTPVMFKLKVKDFG